MPALNYSQIHDRFYNPRDGIIADFNRLADRFGRTRLSTVPPTRATLAAAGAQTGKPMGPNPTPLPAIRVRSDEKAINAMVEAAGAAFLTAWLELVATVSKGGYGDAPKSLTYTHAGRDFTAAVCRVLPYRGIYREVDHLVRFVLVDGERGENESMLKATVAKALGAMADREPVAADKSIRALGSPDGFSTKLNGI